MPDDLDYIIGTMPQGYNVEPNQIGFIPSTKVEQYYIARGFYVLQTNNRGLPVGYALHGKPKQGGLLTIAQALIDIDRRNLGFGETAIEEIVNRAVIGNCRAVKVRCAANLDSNSFWLAMGFKLTAVDYSPNKRNRAINVYIKDLWPRLFE